MLRYIKSEIMKYKRTFANRIIVIAPVLILLTGVISPLWFQLNTFNWWYVCIYPAVITLLSSSIIQIDSKKLNYHAILSFPVDLKKVWYSKIAVGVWYAFISNLVFIFGNFFGAYMWKTLMDIRMEINLIDGICGIICINLTTMWIIPFCLWLCTKIGMWGEFIVNYGLSCVAGVVLAGEDIWIFSPYSWSMRLMVPIIGILPNGIPANGSEMFVSDIMIIFTIIISIILFIVLSIMTSMSFLKNIER